MLRSEFIDRTGFEPTGDEYNEIQTDYLKFNGNKDDFCKHWVQIGGIKRLTRERAAKIEELQKMVLNRDRKIDHMEQYLKDMHRKEEELNDQIRDAKEEAETLGKALTAVNSKLARMKYIIESD